MKIARKVVTVIALAALLCTLMTVAAFAAETGSLWTSIEQTEGTAALIVTDTTVTDGVVKVTYDSSVLTYVSTEVTAEYVAMYAVNAEEAGVVLISWVAPEAYTLDGEAVSLIRVNFSGVEEENTITLTGTAHDEAGNALNFADAPDTSALEKAVAEAGALEETDYTSDSWACLEKALADAEAVLTDGTATQAEVDAAAEALREAMESLTKVSGGDGTGSTDSTTESTTKPTENTGGNASTGDNSHVWAFVAVGVVSAAAIVLLVIKLKKGGSAK